MSLNISSKLLSVAGVTLTIHPSRMSTRTRNSLVRTLETGVMTGYDGVARQIAEYVLKDTTVPHALVASNGRRWSVFNCFPGTELHKRVGAVTTAWALAGAKANEYGGVFGTRHFHCYTRPAVVPQKDLIPMLAAPCAKRDAVVAPYIDAIKNTRPFEVTP